MLHPAFAAAAAAAATQLAREGEITSATAGVLYRANDDDVYLAVRVGGPAGRQIVEEARHSGASDPLVLGTLDVFCQVIEGLPLQEAADHGSIHALERIRGDSLAMPVEGILTPRSAGGAFSLCEHLIRDILAQHQAATGDKTTQNFWNPPLSASWRAKSADERLAALQPLVSRFVADNNLNAGDLQITEIEKARRIVVKFGSGLRHEQKPILLMQFERHVRRATGDRLEVYMEEMKDNNQIRRLGPNEEPS